MKHDYKKLGFKCGLEIHQQLEGTKLFCNCKTQIRKGNPDFKITRKLRAAAGEQGKIDKAAMHEQAKDKYFVYEGYKDINCLVEVDEEPPHPVRSEAIRTALTMAKLLNMELVDKIQFMRKTVVDGSNVSGFQRTALIATDGYIEIKGKKIGVETLCLEEDACQAMQRKKTHDTYNLSRLGIPLLEIATEPTISSPDECKEAARHIGMLLRSCDNIKRGIGSIRQDVNVSIKKGARTEIKGFQEINSIPLVIENEVKRQEALIKKGQKIQESVRRAEKDGTTTYLRPMPGADRMYPETDIKTITPDLSELKIPETIEQKTSRYEKKYGLSKDLARQVTKAESKQEQTYEEHFKKYSSKNLSPTNIADLIINKIPGTQKKEGPLKHLDIKDLLGKLKEGKIAYSSVTEILKESAKKKVDYKKYELLDEKEIKKTVKKIIKENPDATHGLLMGKVMQELKGKADGKTVNEMIAKHKNG